MLTKKISVKKRNQIIWLYLDGMSYDEIAYEANIDKANIRYVIFQLKTGQYPEFVDLSDQIEILRKLTLKLRQVRLEPRKINKERR
ncbi:hypothetical protein ACFLVZ_01100 [Chloroflexota bacterium]